MLILNKYKITDNSNTVYIGRGSPLGNPFVISKHGIRIEVIDMFKQYLIDSIHNDRPLIKTLLSLKNDDKLLCFCAPKPCHGQVIKYFYNQLKTKGLSGVKAEFKSFYPDTESIDHINISKSSKSDLGILLHKALTSVLIDCKSATGTKIFYDELAEKLEKYILDTELSILLIHNNLPLDKYGLRNNKPYRTINSYWLVNTLNNIRSKLGGFKKVVIAGSRTIDSYKLVKDAYIDSNIKASCIISGGAKGVDRLGERLAVENNIKLITILPYWDELGLKAGMIRNKEMFDYADVLIAIWDGKSSGTKNIIDLFRKSGKQVYIKTI